VPRTALHNPDESLLHYSEQEPGHIELPTFEPQTDPEIYRPTVLTTRQPNPLIPAEVRFSGRMRDHSSRPAGLHISSAVLTIICLLFLLASSALAFLLIGNHTLIATAAFSASPNSIRKGDIFTLTGSGFKATSLLHFSFDSNQPLYNVAGKSLTVQSDEHGSFSIQEQASANWSVGRHSLYVSDPSQGLSISTGITVEPPSVASP
jgi:hypothetical protein